MLLYVVIVRQTVLQCLGPIAAKYQGATLIETIGSNSKGILFNNLPSHSW